MRRSQWRNSEKWQPEEKTDEEGNVIPAVKTLPNGQPLPTLALIDDFLDKTQQDEYLAATLLAGACLQMCSVLVAVLCTLRVVDSPFASCLCLPLCFTHFWAASFLCAADIPVPVDAPPADAEE